MQVQESLEQDIADIAKIDIIPTILNVVSSTTGMGFSAVARVTEDRWVTCSVLDQIGFGLQPGDGLEIKTTICNEIRQSHNAVIIDYVAQDPDFVNHHTPAMYGFQSYISVPIIKKDGSFFGTLCAIDPHPRNLKNPQITGMFTLFADLIAFHLDAVQSLRTSEVQLMREKAFTDVLEKKVTERTAKLEENNLLLQRSNNELKRLAFISSHDLQEPLRKIQTITSYITDKEIQNLTEKGQDYIGRLRNSAKNMQSKLNGLVSYSRTIMAERQLEKINLADVWQNIEMRLCDEIASREISIEKDIDCELIGNAQQIENMLYNLLDNSIKFTHPEKPLRIAISSSTGHGKIFGNKKLKSDVMYCKIALSDNGIGFEEQYNERIFELFQKLDPKSSGTGIGLAIARKIVENHNGYIDATGSLGEGTRFQIYIPKN